MTTPAENMRRKPMGEVRPYDNAARFFGAPGATRASPRAEPTAWLAESPEKRRNARQSLEKDGHMANSG